MRRKGYMYAIEGVIASLLALIYIGSMISAPSPTDWTNTAISKRSGDFMDTLSRTGWLDRSVTRDNPEVLRGIAESMDLGMDYSMYVSGIPDSSISASLLLEESEIYRSSSHLNNSLSTEDGLPINESTYREGEILETPFVLSDTKPDDQTVYNSVNFDLNGNGEYDDIVDGVREGPYLFGDILDACLGSVCKKFSVGYINDTLTLYGLEDYNKLVEHRSIEAGSFSTDVSYTPQELREDIQKNEGQFEKEETERVATEGMQGVEIEIKVGGQNSSVRFNISSRTTNRTFYEEDRVLLLGEIYSIESIMPFKAVPENSMDSDVLLAKGTDPNLLDRKNESIKSFLSQDGILIEMLDLQGWDKQRFESSVQEEIGLEWRDLPITSGSSINRFSSGELGSSTERYFNAIEVSLDRSRYTFNPDSDNPSYAVANITLRGQNMTVNSSLDGSVSIYTGDKKEEGLIEGEETSLAGNLYRVEETFPLELSTSSKYNFRNFYGSKIIGDASILTVSGRQWNRSAGSFNVTLGEAEDAPPGAPSTECSNRKYFTGEFTFRGETYPLLATNRQPCNRGLEYINFDFNNNGRFNDSEISTGVGYSSEGIHQEDEKISVDSTDFRIRADNMSWMYLERQVGESVSSAVKSTNVRQGEGDVIFMGNVDTGDDDVAFLKAVLMRSSVRRSRFTDTLSIGSSASGLTYAGKTKGEFSTPYTIDSAWWFQ